MQSLPGILNGRKALIVGLADERSVAYGCAKAFVDAGAELALTWATEKSRLRVEPIARALGVELTARLDLAAEDDLARVIELIAARWGRLDIVVHSVAFAPRADLHGALLDSSPEGFARAMDVSCHSFIRLAKATAPLMREGGALFAMSFIGAQRVVPNYAVMGPVKAALEAACRYLAIELAPNGIRVNALSTGLMKTRAAAGVKDFDALYDSWEKRAPLGAMEASDVGHLCAFLASPLGAKITGETIYVDSGAHLF